MDNSTQTINLFNLNIIHPPYFHRDIENDIGKVNPKNQASFEQLKRIVNIALPFISLHPAAGQPIARFLGISRSVKCLFSLKEAWNLENKKPIPLAVLQTAIAITEVACTFFAPPLGMLITTGENLVCHASQLIEALKNEEYKRVLILSAEIANHSLYLCLFFTGASQIVIASLSIQILLGLHHSYKEFTDKNYIEAFGQLLLVCLKGHQLQLEVSVLQLQRSIDQHVAEIKQAPLKIKRDSEEKGEGPNNETIEKDNDLVLSAYDGRNNTPSKKILKKVQELLKKANKYLNQPEIKDKQAAGLDLSKQLPQSASDTEIIDALLKDHPGFCIGEDHSHVSPRAFLMNNMDYLKKKNVRVLFSETWNYKDQKLIDRYLSINHLRQLNQKDRKAVGEMLEYSKNEFSQKPGSPYTHFAMLETAKRTGIRLVAIDYDPSYQTYVNDFVSKQERLAKMNFVADKVIKSTKKTLPTHAKFVAFMGSAHLRRGADGTNVPGVADLTETPALLIIDGDRISGLSPLLSYSGILGLAPINILVRWPWMI